MNVRYVWGRQGADTFYTKISPIYINLENLLSDEMADELEFPHTSQRCLSEFGNYSLAGSNAVRLSLVTALCKVGRA